MGEPIRVLLADDHPIVRQGLRVFLNVQADIDVVGEVADGAQVAEAVRSLRPDVVLLDLKMPGVDGLAALRSLADEESTPRVLVLTSVTGAAAVREAMGLGAAGFVYKDIDPDALAQAIRSVADGQLLFAPEAARVVMSSPVAGAEENLTGRERQVLTLLAAGRSNREIARRLAVTEKTVKSHVSAVLRKLGVADRTQAALYAVAHGLVDGM